MSACSADAGAAALQAVQTIQQLQLFPAVFLAPPPLAQQLGPDYGRPCTAVMSAAAALLDELGKEVQPWH